MENIIRETFKGVLKNGADYDMAQVSSCRCRLSGCEKECAKHSSCHSVSMANDVLADYEKAFDELRFIVLDFIEANRKEPGKVKKVLLADNTFLWMQITERLNDDKVSVKYVQFEVTKSEDKKKKILSKTECAMIDSESIERTLRFILHGTYPVLYQFLSCVNQGDISFTLKDPLYVNGTYLHFLRGEVGDAYFYYYANGNSDCSNANLNLKYECGAIERDGKIYLIDPFIFGVYQQDIAVVLPDNMISMYAYIAECNKTILRPEMISFFDSIHIDETSCEYLDYCERYKSNLYRLARKNALSMPEKVEDYADSIFDSFNSTFTRMDIVNNICKGISLKDVAKEKFEEQKKRLIILKMDQHFTEKIVAEMKIEEWEHTLAKAVLDLDVKYVNVFFEFHGQSVSAKMTPKSIWENLYTEDWLGAYDFATYKEGEKVLALLGASAYGEAAEKLYLKHITKITYGKKVLYEREK